ncbi:MAG: hypothetical protein JWM85_1118 [Acidimicrobiaceae bacterium]|nr:hypothetical protein [Acidimicrobiaceae bacterium]
MEYTPQCLVCLREFPSPFGAPFTEIRIIQRDKTVSRTSRNFACNEHVLAVLGALSHLGTPEVGRPGTRSSADG